MRIKFFILNKIILAVFLGVFGMLSILDIHAQDAKTVFINMPDSLCPLLTSVNRADCIDFLESKMKAQVENRFGKKSEMTDLSKDYIRVQMTSQTSWQMKLLPVKDTVQVICVVSTACAPACDSSIHFYTMDWKALPSHQFITLPVMDNFLETPDSASVYLFESARLQADLLLMKADFNKENDSLSFTLTTPDYMEKETAEKLKLFLRRSLVFQWKENTSGNELSDRFFTLSDTH